MAVPLRLDHGFPQLVRERERRPVLHAKIAAEGKHAFAILLVAERCDCHQVVLERELVRSKQGARGYREVGATRLAAPPRLIRRAGATVAGRASTARTHRLAIRLGPPQAGEYLFSPTIRHPRHFARIERTNRFGQEKMLRHGSRPRRRTKHEYRGH